MKCGGTYKFNREEHECSRKWACQYFSIRSKLQKWIPDSENSVCTEFKPDIA